MTAPPSADQIEQAWAISDLCSSVNPDLSPLDSLAEWTGDPSMSIDGPGNVAAALDCGLSRRVGRNTAGFTSREWMAYNSLQKLARKYERDLRLSTSRGINVQEILKHKSEGFSLLDFRKAADAIVLEDLYREFGKRADWRLVLDLGPPPRRAFDICKCGTVFEKTRPNKIQCSPCKTRGKKHPMPPNVTAFPVAVNGAVGYRFIGICDHCEGELDRVRKTRIGRPITVCEFCAPAPTPSS